MNNPTIERIERLQALRDLALLSSEQVRVYDELTLLASKTIKAPVSLMSMVAANYQFFKSQVGLKDPWSSQRSTPLSHSFCKHVVENRQPLIVSDARTEPILQGNLAIRDLSVIGYLGIPLTLDNGETMGSFCVIDSEPRQWTRIEIEIMTELAELVMKEFNARSKVRRGGERAKQDLQKLQLNILSIIEKLDTGLSHEQFLSDLRTYRHEYDV